MKKTLLEIYALATCFGAIVCFAISLGIGMYGMIGIVDPEITLDSWKYSQHQTNDAWWESKNSSAFPPPAFSPQVEIEDTTVVRPAEDEFTRQRLESYSQVLKIEKRDNKQSVLRISIILFVCAILFIIHWRIAKNART